MITVEEIKNSSKKILELKDYISKTFNINSKLIPLGILSYIKNNEVSECSDPMFRYIINCVGCYGFNSTIINHAPTVEWLEHDTIKGWICIKYGNESYIFFLNSIQQDVLVKVANINESQRLKNYNNFEDYIKFVENIVKVSEFSSIKTLTDKEKECLIVKEYTIPENSKSLDISEHLSRFSGAMWFNEIQKKTIILAGLGGIGSYVCFLLARVRPKSLFIYDDDIVEAGNMSGQLYSTDNIDEYKVKSMSNMVEKYANYTNMFAIQSKFTENNEPTDIMICGFDNMESRKTFFTKWYNHVMFVDPEHRSHCLFIDGRLSAEYFQVYCITGDNADAIVKYRNDALFSDDQADETLCSYKQTTYMANMIGSIIVNLFTNFVANEVAHAPIRELPYLTSYDGNSMQLKIE